MLRGVGACGELAFHRRFHQQAGVCDHVLQRRSDAVDGQLHFLVVALVGLRDQFVDLAVGYLGQDAVAFAYWKQDRVQHVVDAFHDTCVGTLELLGFAAFGELPFTRCLGQSPRLLLQPLQRHGYAVNRLLHLLVVAAVGLGDQLVDLARANPRQNAIALSDWQKDRVEHRVHAFDHFAVAAFESLGLPAFAEAACARGFHQGEYLLLQQIRGLRSARIGFRTVQNGGAGGRVSAGRNSPAVVDLSCHSFTP